MPTHGNPPDDASHLPAVPGSRPMPGSCSCAPAGRGGAASHDDVAEAILESLEQGRSRSGPNSAGCPRRHRQRRLRRERRHRRILRLWTDEIAAAIHATSLDSTDPFERVAAREGLERLGILSTLDRAILLDLASGFSHREIAARHGLSQAAVRQRVCRARRSLRKGGMSRPATTHCGGRGPRPPRTRPGTARRPPARTPAECVPRGATSGHGGRTSPNAGGTFRRKRPSGTPAAARAGLNSVPRRSRAVSPCGRAERIDTRKETIP